MQDIEFTIQQGRLFILQTRSGKRTGTAAVKIAVDMVNEELLDKREATLKLVEPRHLDQLLHPQLSQAEVDGDEIIGKGLPASPGAAVGKVVFNSEEAERKHEEGEPVILVRIETSPEDVGGMSASEGDFPRRDDKPCCRCSPGMGETLCCRMRRYCHQLRIAIVYQWRNDH